MGKKRRSRRSGSPLDAISPERVGLGATLGNFTTGKKRRRK